MPNYQVTFIWNLSGNGWTETYYRYAASGRLATYFGGVDGLLPWLAIRPPIARLEAIRAQNVDGKRESFLRLCGFNGIGSDTPNVTSISARLWIPFVTGSGRSLWLRGLVDGDVRRNTKGHDEPSASFLQNLEFIKQRIKEFSLRGKRIRQDNPWAVIKNVGPSELGPELTAIEIKSSLELKPGDYVYHMGERILGIKPEKKYLVWEITGNIVHILSTWYTGLPLQKAHVKNRLRKLEYEFPSLDVPAFAEFSRFRTSTEYRAASWYPLIPGSSPIHPCGRIVDFIRKGYTVGMRIFRDDPGLAVPVRWYFPEQENHLRQAIPYDHPFGSRSWDLESEYALKLGEVYERQWHSGREEIDVRGIGLCGSIDQWENGCSQGDDVRPMNPGTGQPCCCGPGSLAITGGAAAAGPSLQSLNVLQQITGGAAAAGPTVIREVSGGAAAGSVDYGKKEISGGAAGGGPTPFGLGKAVRVQGGAAAAGKSYHDTGDRVEDCDSCPDGAWTQYRVLIEGGTGDAEHWNGDWVVAHSGFCFWGFEIPETGDNIGLVFIADGEEVGVVVNLVGGAPAAYSVTGSANCDGPWTLIRQGGGGQGHPETIFVEHYE